MPNQYHYGWKKMEPDHRDFHFHPPLRLVRGSPLSLDLANGMGPQLDQGSEKSCGPNTSAEIITFDQMLQKLASFTPSRQLIYWFTRLLMGTTSQDSGVDNRTMGKALQQYGFCDESLWPYLPGPGGNMTTPPSQQAQQAALANRITNYSFIGVNRAAMQGTLNSGFLFCMGGEVFQGIEGQQAAATGVVPMPSGSAVGGHDISCCGYNFTGNALPGVKPGNLWPSGTYKFRNHWLNSDGSPWGDGGYGYIPADYAENADLMSDYMVINAVPGASPSPTPQPTPVPVPTPQPSNVQAVLAYVDQFFVLMERQYPRYAVFLRQVNALLDQYVQGHVSKSDKDAMFRLWTGGLAPTFQQGTFNSIDWTNLVSTIQKLLPLVEQLVEVIRGSM